MPDMFLDLYFWRLLAAPDHCHVLIGISPWDGCSRVTQARSIRGVWSSLVVPAMVTWVLLCLCSHPLTAAVAAWLPHCNLRFRTANNTMVASHQYRTTFEETNQLERLSDAKSGIAQVYQLRRHAAELFQRHSRA